MYTFGNTVEADAKTTSTFATNTTPTNIIISSSSNSGKRKMFRKAATFTQPKVKPTSKRSTVQREEGELGMGVTHRPLIPPAATRKYEDKSTRIQRRSQSRARDSLLTMLRGYAPKERVYVMTQTDGMRF